jgi:ABC-type polysaccharide/polyol phosphate transport system ATPase subunit
MNDLVIQVRDVRKVYRLYAGPGYRFLDMFGLLGDRAGAYTEHAAIDGISLTIRRGEKVAFIGRNGAGKSTLLKLFTKVIEPTSGSLEVKGKAHALLQIGSGFHPDFTGRENVYAYLAQLGVAGREADRKYAEIVEFAELEEYIGQPVKTYSSGMAVRLMFSTSTAITPDLLVLDEILGVGDAYFANKSYTRIRELCEREQTTLLLVSHDIYSAVKLCERLIWIDQGRILLDGAGPLVVTAYEDSIRKQEEVRLRRRKQDRLKALDDEAAATAEPSPPRQRVLFEIQAKHNLPQPCPVYFSAVRLMLGDEMVAELPLATDAAASESHLEFEAACWGPPAPWHGRTTRPFLNYGSSFHKAVGVFAVRPGVNVHDCRVTLDYWSDEPCDVVLRCFANNAELALGALPPAAAEWAHHETAVRPDALPADAAAGVSLTGRQGSGAIAVRDVRTLNGQGEETPFFRHEEPFTLMIGYTINQPELAERAQVLIAFHRDGVLDVCRVWTRELLFDAAARPRGHIRLHLPRLYLAAGTFTITVMIAEQGYYDQQQTRYFSLNPGVYTCLSRVVEIVISDGRIVGTGTGVVGDGEWELLDA